jgi:cellulose synthase/poly-beta-1,6-N-acetylglucosamine synthase-like glycosyltransferase
VSDVRRRPVEPVVTVIVPARDEEGSIARCLASVLAQDEPRLQVIVVDGGSTDATAAIVDEIAARDPRVELIHHGIASIPGSLNAALAATVARWVVRVDAHSAVPPGYVAALMDHLETGRWGGVGGRKDAVAETAAGRAIAAALSSRFGVGNSVYHYGTHRRTVDHVPFGAYPTETLRELGGWDERLVANEDYELDYRLRRAGHELLFDPELRIAWRCRDTIGELFRQYVRYGRGKADVAALHPTSLQPRHLAPPAVLILLVAAGTVSVVSPLAGLAIAAPYAVALAAAVAVTARKVPAAKEKAMLPAAFVAMHVGWGIGFVRGVAAVLTGRGPRRRPATRAADRARTGIRETAA